jgi:hypothetical protein
MKTLKIAALAVVAMAVGVQAQAEQQTNLVQNLSIQLVGVSQGSPFSFGGTSGTNVNNVFIGTRQVIQALGSATANTFSSASRLVVVTPIEGGDAHIQVRDGSNTVDVTDFLVAQEVSGSVDGSVSTLRPVRSTSVSYLISRFALQDMDGATLSLHFDVNGFTTINSSTGGFFGAQGPTTNANVSGTGDRNGNPLILQGSIVIFGRTLEVVETGPILS